MKRFRLFLAVGLAACGLTYGPTVFAAEGFVQASGTKLLLDGKAFTPAGINQIQDSTLWDKARIAPKESSFALDFRRFSALGFNSVRLGIKADYFSTEKGFAWLDARLREAKKYKLKILLDMHIPTGGAQQDYQPSDENQKFWDDVTQQEKFIATWGRIAKRYAQEKNIWGYDVMNEPSSRNAEQVSALYQSLINEIRRYDRNHLVLVQAVQMYDEAGEEILSFPKIEDPNQAYDIHYFRPYGFTMQNTAWGKSSVNILARYPGTATGTGAWNAQRIIAELDRAGLAQARAAQVPAVLGEFGAVFSGPLRGQYFWIQDVLTAARKAGLGWHYWVYKTDKFDPSFGLTDGKGNTRWMTLQLLADNAKATLRAKR